MVVRKRSCLYKLRFGTYPRGLPFFGSYRGHYPIVEFEIWPFQPRVKLSLSTMRPLIDIFSRCSCNVACSSRSFSCTLSFSLLRPVSLACSHPPSLLTLLLYPTFFFFSLSFRIFSRSGPVQRRARMLLLSRAHAALPLDLF